MKNQPQIRALLVCFISMLVSSLIFSVPGMAQEKQQISGTVKSTDGTPIAGVSVRLKGAPDQQTSTDANGKFNLSNVSLQQTLSFSFVGYESKDVQVQTAAPLTVVLSSLSEQLDDVVVIGYGIQRKGDVTSSVARVTQEDFTQGAVKDVGQLIQGKVAGLAVTNPSGDPAGGTQIKLRGTNSMGGANTDPLVLIDGIPGDLGQVAPEDVETVDVLKDGSAAAIYGTRGTNGVILITTKQGRSGDVNSVDYNGFVSTQQIANKLDMLDANEFRSLYPEEDHGGNTDWLDEITRTPVSHSHNLSLRGGGSSTGYVANVNYNQRQGIMLKSDNENFRGRLEINHQLFDNKVRVKFGVFGRQNQYESTSNNGSFRGGA